MYSRSALVAVVLACLAVTGAIGSVALGAPGSQAGGRELLPDLDPELPNQLLLQTAGDRKRPTFLLGFQSATSNVGEGPLIIDGHRVDLGTPTMAADQIVERDAGPDALTRNVGRLRFVRSPDHRHWHLLRFMRYELRRAGSDQARVRDRKTGFCLGDRYPVRGRDLPARAAKKVYTTRCGLNLLDRLRIREGISVGFGDNYTAFLEGQALPLNGLRDGRYVLVHRVNVERRIRELSYDNDASSVLLDLRWAGKVPHLRVLASCPDTDRCDLPPDASPL
jgi:Lysyl oxidase